MSCIGQTTVRFQKPISTKVVFAPPIRAYVRFPCVHLDVTIIEDMTDFFVPYTGDIDGTNREFTLTTAAKPGKVIVVFNGQELDPESQYTVDVTNTIITLNFVPLPASFPDPEDKLWFHIIKQ